MFYLFLSDGCFESTGFEFRNDTLVSKFRFHGTAILKNGSKYLISPKFAKVPPPYKNMEDTFSCGPSSSIRANVWMEGEFTMILSSTFKVKSLGMKS